MSENQAEQTEFAARISAELARISDLPPELQIEALKSLHALLEETLNEAK